MSDPGRAMAALLALMDRLRDPAAGCPWDRQQSFSSIAPYTIEEAYEVADAITRGDPQQLRDELGDLLFQIVFHARLAQERGWFDFAAVAGSIHDKLVRRHPHVFADAVFDSAESQNRHWEELKARERAELASRSTQADDSALAGIPLALPALARAAKIGRRAGRVGFDWPEIAQVRDKVVEELAEVDAAVAAQSPADIAEELGDLLFAVANWSRHLQVDPEESLRRANAKFERRFRQMERQVREQGLVMDELTLAQWEALWQAAKGWKTMGESQ